MHTCILILVCLFDVVFPGGIINVQQHCSQLIGTFTSHHEMSAPREITGPSLTKTHWAKMPVERQSGLFEWVRAAAPNTPSKYRVGAQHPPDKWRGWRGQWMIFHVFKLLEPIGLIPLNNSLHPISFWQQQQRKQLLQMNAVYVWCETRLLSKITTDKLMFIYTNIFQRQNKQLTDLKLEI